MPKVLRSFGLDERLKNLEIIAKWPEIVGEKIAQHAKAIGVDTENLFVAVDNPVWQGQLFLMKDKIVNKIKKYGVHIKDIKFSIQELPSKKESE